MAQPGINAKIEELQFRLKTDPKSRLFFPLAEELRKFGKLPEAEQVLRTGLGVHSTYLSAWVSLGRVLREQHKNDAAVEALNTALKVDPGNVVAARLLGDTYFDLGDKVEAIKKYKLVHALMGADEELEAKIESLERDIHPPESAPPPAAPAQPVAPIVPLVPPAPVDPPAYFASEYESPQSAASEPESPFASEPESPFAAAVEPDVPVYHSRAAEPVPYEQTIDVPFEAEAVPAPVFEEKSPFDQSFPHAALPEPEVQRPEALYVGEAGAADAPSVWIEDQPEEPSQSEPAADVFAPAQPDSPSTEQDHDVTATTTMGDLYVRQGLIENARRIYEQVLSRDPSDHEVRAKLDSLNESPPPASVLPEEGLVEEPEPEAYAGRPKVVVLQRWLARVGRREEGHA